MLCNEVYAQQCNDTIYPSPKRFKNPNYWPYSMRPATACELNFYRKFHAPLFSAFNRIIEYYKAQRWETTSPDLLMGEKDQMQQWDDEGRYYNTGLKVMQKSEKTFFSLIDGLGYFDWAFDNSTVISAEYGTLNDAYTNLITKDTKGSDSELISVTMKMEALTAKSNIKIAIPNINCQKDELKETNAKIESVNIKGAAYAVKINRSKIVKDISLNTNVNDLDELHLYIGKWKAPQILNTATAQTLLVQNNFNVSQPKLSIQNFMVVIKTDAANFDEIIATINFAKLNQQILQ